MKASRDIPNTTIESLKSLGLTKYEALVYIGLLRVAGATATEIHEISGVPRASVYPVLDRLVQKELVSVSHTTPKRFDAIPPDRGIENLMRRIEDDAENARVALDVFYREKDSEGRGNQELIWTVYGEENIKTRLADMIRSAEQSVEMLVSWNLLEGAVLALLEPLPDSVQVDIVTDCWKGEQPSRFGVHVHPLGTLYEGRAPSGKALRYESSGVFLVDDARALLWMGSAGEQPSALYSESAGLVQFVRRYLSSVTEWVGADQ
ncbi:TrmB family transcriptional regulator [Methanoculleus sp. 7T]|mgnify:CR=1 FL=1|uniref:TrmB family transcriptional regulator n=1 Tax=Methanoculleus sp. 7T TaxID=2937282 RepID=UPI0020BE9FBD|nr:helix-turn-helix domain-containing protein [Methanoculleus sp. 7T]MCK8519110.1 TrmB family transcriptional regulator [Methanoculleus sp. 7T]